MNPLNSPQRRGEIVSRFKTGVNKADLVQLKYAQSCVKNFYWQPLVVQRNCKKKTPLAVVPVGVVQVVCSAILLYLWCRTPYAGICSIFINR